MNERTRCRQGHRLLEHLDGQKRHSAAIFERPLVEESTCLRMSRFHPLVEEFTCLRMSKLQPLLYTDRCPVFICIIQFENAGVWNLYSLQTGMVYEV